MSDLVKKTNYLDISPAKKGKRMLVFLADLFLNFILTFLIFNIVVSPSAKKICDFETLNSNHIVYTNKMYSLFYKNNLVYKSQEFPEYDLVDNIDYTFDNFLSYYVCDDKTVLNEGSLYGKQIENEVLFHYYYDILENELLYINLIDLYNSQEFFVHDDISITGIKLKENIAEELEAYFDIRNEMSEIGRKYYSQIKEKIYFPVFAEIMESIKMNDLSHPDVDMSYLYCITEITKLENFHKTLLSICSVISYIFSCLIYYFLIPVLFENHKTLGMYFLRFQRMEFTTLGKIKNTHFIANAFYSILTNASLIMFLPMMLVPFNYLFSISALLYTSLIASIFDIIGMIFILFSKFNRSWGDMLTSIVHISNDSLDAIYRSKGYKI